MRSSVGGPRRERDRARHVRGETGLNHRDRIEDDQPSAPLSGAMTARSGNHNDFECARTLGGGKVLGNHSCATDRLLHIGVPDYIPIFEA